MPSTTFDTGNMITHTAASAGVNGPDMDGSFCKGMALFINITAITGTSPTLTVTLQGKSAVSGQYYTILASAALTTTGLTVLRVYPGLTAAANTVANDIIPNSWRVISAIGGTTPAVTATVTASVLE